MSPLLIGVFGIFSLIVLIVLRVPVAVALATVGFFGYAAIDGWHRANLMIGGVPLEFASNYTLSVVPLFTLMGACAAGAGLSTDLFRFGRVLFRGARGSLAIASIFASALFGAICGSSVATALTMSKVSIPPMLSAGYPSTLAAGAVAAGGTLGILIPPSVILMIYAIIAQQSVAILFLAALIPGIILTLLYCIIAVVFYIRATRRLDVSRDLGQRLEKISPAFGRIWHVIGLFGLTLGGIYVGWFTPTEAAAVGALGALVLGFVLRRYTLYGSAKFFSETVRLTSNLIFIVLASTIFSYFIVQTEISRNLLDVIKEVGLGSIGFIVVVSVSYIIMGCFLEGIGMMLITVPIILPLVLSFGFDPVWFGVLLVIVIEAGLISPPMGLNLFAISAVTNEIDIVAAYKGAAPFLLAPLILIGLMVAFPQIVLWLPAQIQ